MKFSATKTLAVVALAALPALASAQLTANLSLTSNYKFRGQDQDVIAGGSTKDKAVKPALQGGFDYDFGNGFYAGNWNSSVNWLAGNSLEVDLYGGYKGEVSGVGYDVGAIAYLYPGNSNGNTTEIYGGLSYAGFGAKYYHTVSDDYFFYGSKASYLNLSYSTEIAKGLTVSASVGKTYFKTAGFVDFVDYSVGLGYDLGSGMTLKGAVQGASKRATYGFPNKNRLVVTLTKAM